MEEASKSDIGLVDIRRYKAGDLPLILDSWLNSFRDGAFVRGIPDNIYYDRHRRVVDDLLKRSFVLVLCSEKNPNVIVGWLCGEKTAERALIIHYVYIKRRFRKQGFGRILVQMLLDLEKPVAVVYTHKTFFVRDYREACRAAGKDFPLADWIYNPYQVFSNLTKDWDRAGTTAAVG